MLSINDIFEVLAPAMYILSVPENQQQGNSERMVLSVLVTMAFFAHHNYCPWNVNSFS